MTNELTDSEVPTTTCSGGSTPFFSFENTAVCSWGRLDMVWNPFTCTAIIINKLSGSSPYQS